MNDSTQKNSINISPPQQQDSTSNNPHHTINNDNLISFSHYEEIFTPSDLKEINESSSPKVTAFNILEKYLLNKYGKVEIQQNLLMAQAEFHSHNLTFLLSTYKTFPLEIICKLLNLCSILLDLNENEYNINIPHSAMGEEDESGKYNQVPEPDLSYICTKKIKYLKQGLKYLKFIPLKKEEQHNQHTFNYNSNIDNTNQSNDTYYLSNEEVSALLEYLKTFYFPFIRLYYHFINIDRITESKKIEVVINRPSPVPPLVNAVNQKLEKNIFEDTKEEFEEEESEGNEEGEEEDDEAKVNDDYQDIMNRVNMNNETRKIITERIDELEKDFDAKIYDRQRELDAKVKEAEETMKPKKK